MDRARWNYGLDTPVWRCSFVPLRLHLLRALQLFPGY